MLKWLRSIFFISLTEEESKQANKCKERTLNILKDALKKKDALLVGNPAEFRGWKELSSIPLISTDLVKDLISQLQKVTFRRSLSQSHIAYVFPGDGDGTVYLCPQFWKQHEFLQLLSRPGALIYETSRLLGYENTTEKNTEKVQKSQQHKFLPVSASNIEVTFSYCMVHEGSYTNGSYSCCGEKSRDTVCRKSLMSCILRYLYTREASPLSEQESKLANAAKQRALNILNDALKKEDSLLVDPEKVGEEKKSRFFPLISPDLVRGLIGQLQKVTFKRNKDPERESRIIAFVRPSDGDRTVYLSRKFFEQQEFLQVDSRPETLIHEVAHLLGYGHTIGENEEKVKTSQQQKLCPVSVHNIETAFSLYMNHRGTYTNGSYSCCGETSRDTLCEKSAMALALSDLSGMDDHVRKRILGLMFLLENLRLLSLMQDLLTQSTSIIPAWQREDDVTDSSWVILPVFADWAKLDEEI